MKSLTAEEAEIVNREKNRQRADHSLPIFISFMLQIFNKYDKREKGCKSSRLVTKK